MITPPPGVRVYLACGYTDMRKGMATLAVLVQQTLGGDPFICVGREYVAAPRPQEANSAVMMDIAAT
jgi:transposase